MARVAEVWLVGEYDKWGEGIGRRDVLGGVGAGEFAEERVAACNAAMF